MKHENIRNMLHQELKNIENRGQMTPDTVCLIYQITGALHRLDEIEESEEIKESYQEDYQGRRGRNSMGRYTSRSQYGQYGGNQNDYDWLKSQVNDMMMDSDSEKEKEAYRKVLRRLSS